MAIIIEHMEMPNGCCECRMQTENCCTLSLKRIDDIFTRPSWCKLKEITCKDCKHYKQSAVADRKMCFRKDVDGVEVCYDFLPDDSCTYGERKDGGEND